MTLHQSLAKAQAEFKPIRFDSQAQLGGGRNYRYASIAAILDGVRPILNKHGILLSQEPSQTEGVVSVTTRLSLGEQSISSTLSAPMSRGGFHELGSAITYLRRYGLASMLGVAAEEDEDGHAAQSTAGGSKAAPPTFLTREGEELRCGTFSKTWVDCLVNEQRNTDRVWQLTLSPPKKDGDAWQIEGLKWVTEGGELIDPDMADVPF
jgi:hypothetical protein